MQLPRLGKLRVKECSHLPETARILSVIVSRTAERWYVALRVTGDGPTPPKKAGFLLALDKGVRVFGALSLGLPIPNPHFLQSQARKLRCVSQALSRKKKGSKNKQKAAWKLTDFYCQITAARQDLFIKGLMQNRNLSKY
ncbi:MAG: transposase [Promethearchaeota archaeon]